MSTTLAFSSSSSMFSSFHHMLNIFCTSSRFSPFSSFSSSVGISSGPGAFLLFSFLMMHTISATVGASVLYSCVFGSIICVGFCEGVSSSVLLLCPHCISLRYLAANCALLSRVICFPSLSLLW